MNNIFMGTGLLSQINKVGTSNNSYYSNNFYTTTCNDTIRSYYVTKELTYDNIYDQLSDKSLPVVSKEVWDKILPMLESSDVEIIKLAFGLLEGYRFPPGVLNLIYINKAINTFLTKTNVY